MKQIFFHASEVRVVEASAGSGKTYTLAKRYTQLLLYLSHQNNQTPIRQILALTFTNKAAFEMKVRILEFLKLIALRKFTPHQMNDIIAPLGMTEEAASRQASALMEDVIRNYNFFQVQTIDKFINSLLVSCAFKIGLTANFRIKTNWDEYLEYALDQLIDQASDDKHVYAMFEYFLHNYLFLENRTGWFPKQDMLAIMSTLFHQNNSYGYPFVETPFQSKDLIKKKGVILEAMRELHTMIPKETDKRFVKILDGFLRERKSFDIDSVSDYFARNDIPVLKGCEVSRNLESLWGKIRRDLKELCDAEANSIFNPYIQVFNHVTDILAQSTSKDDILFLGELNKKAASLFSNNQVSVGELYYRLATRFRHYLIDEFQDTSRLQWKNLSNMANEALSSGGTFFYVGDKKQAIYEFRGGDVDLFDELKSDYQHLNLQIETLSNNWRSHKVIVEFNNAIFSLSNLSRFIAAKEAYEIEKNKKVLVKLNEEDGAHLEAIFGNCVQTYQPQNTFGFVKMEYIDGDQKGERDEVIREKLIALLGQLRQRFAYRDIAILSRSNAHIEQITNWLLEESILVESERTSNIQDNALIIELMHFLKFLNSSIDNLAFTSFILGELFPTASGIDSQKLHDFVFSLRERLRHEKDLYVYMEFRMHFKEAWDQFFEEFYRNVGLYPLYELVVSIYSKFQCLKHFGHDQGFLMHFLELIKTCEEDHSDIDAFLEYFEKLKGEDLYVYASDSDSVKLLTIHKAKGLEFPVVILPHLGIDIQVGSSADYQQSYILQIHEEMMSLMKLKDKYLKFSDDLYQIYAKEYKKAFFSELNNIYVALTRAKCEMYGFIPKKIGSSFNFAACLIPEELYERGSVHHYTTDEKKASQTLNLAPSKYTDLIDYLKDEFLDADQVRNREQRQEGEIIHFMLSLIGNLSKVKISDLLPRIKQQAGHQYPHIGDFSAYVKIIEQLIGNDQLKQFFYAENTVIFTEKDIVSPQGHTKRIDRLMVTEKEVWVIDYKSSRDVQRRDEDQIRDYMAMVKGVYAKHRVKGYLVYLDGLELREVKSEII